MINRFAHGHSQQMSLTYKIGLILFLIITQIFSLFGQNDKILKDKTLVVWVSPKNLTQTGGSALTIDDRSSHFDGIVFGEIDQKKWMAGSDNFRRTEKDQKNYPSENIPNTKFVQIAIVYQGLDIILYRNSRKISSYQIKSQQEFNAKDHVVLFGKRHLDVGNEKASFEGRIQDARIYDFALTEDQLSHLKPDKVTQDIWPTAWWTFTNNNYRDDTKTYDKLEFVGDVSIQDGCLVLNGEGATMIASKSSGTHSSWDKESKVSKTIIQNTRSFREKLLSDPYRPAYHFCVPEDRGHPGDPNGAFYHNGRYHLMYLYNREGSGFSWGHVSSKDLLHWRHHQDGIGPGEGDEGCFSGGGFVDDNGEAYLSYWMLWGDKGIGLAKSSDLENWTKLAENPVIKSTEWGITDTIDKQGNSVIYGSADPSNIWKKDGKYYILTGNLLVLNKLGRKVDSQPKFQGDWLDLFVSEDLKNWDYLHRFYQSKREWTESSEDNMCPSFLPLPKSSSGGQMSDKHLLLFISHNLGCQYYIGDYSDDRFTPEKHGRMTWTDNSYFAPEALVDNNGRQIMWSWIFDDRPEDLKQEYGWTGTYGVPRSLWLRDDGSLGISPVIELDQLRMNGQKKSRIVIHDSMEIQLNEMTHELMEIQMTIESNSSQEFGIKVCQSEDGDEETIITYNYEKKLLSIDTRKSGKIGKKVVESAPLELEKDEVLRLKIYIDRSIIEVFANDKQAIARRIYPSSGSNGMSIFSNGGYSLVRSINTWEMMPSNSY